MRTPLLGMDHPVSTNRISTPQHLLVFPNCPPCCYSTLTISLIFPTLPIFSPFPYFFYFPQVDLELAALEAHVLDCVMSVDESRAAAAARHTASALADATVTKHTRVGVLLGEANQALAAAAKEYEHLTGVFRANSFDNLCVSRNGRQSYMPICVCPWVMLLCRDHTHVCLFCVGCSWVDFSEHLSLCVCSRCVSWTALRPYGPFSMSKLTCHASHATPKFFT